MGFRAVWIPRANERESHTFFIHCEVHRKFSVNKKSHNKPRSYATILDRALKRSSSVAWALLFSLNLPPLPHPFWYCCNRLAVHSMVFLLVNCRPCGWVDVRITLTAEVEREGEGVKQRQEINAEKLKFHYMFTSCQCLSSPFLM